jgi:glycosyltransferase involved in cell wall biosynthesis
MSSAPLSLVIRTLNAADTLGAVLTRASSRRGRPAHRGGFRLQRWHGRIGPQPRRRACSIRKEDFSYGRALNRGFAAARHEWVLSLSAHTIPADAGFLDSYRKAIGQFPDSVSAAVGPILGEFDAALSGGITYFEGDDLGAASASAPVNPNSLYRRKVWLRRPFDEELGERRETCSGISTR